MRKFVIEKGINTHTFEPVVTIYLERLDGKIVAQYDPEDMHFVPKKDAMDMVLIAIKEAVPDVTDEELSQIFLS